MILYSITYPRSRISWRIDKKAVGKKAQRLRLYENFEGEDLRKDFPSQKNIIIYDDPADFLNCPAKWDLYNELLEERYHIHFSQNLDIALVNDTNILERVFDDVKYVSIRRNVMTTNLYKNSERLINSYIKKEHTSSLRLKVFIPPELPYDRVLQLLLTIGYWNSKTKYRVWLTPVYGRHYYKENKLVWGAFNYLRSKPYKMSYYEYIFNIGYLREGVPKSLIHTGEDKYEYIYANYPQPGILLSLEKWIVNNPEYKEHVFIGGTSDYERGRKKYYDIGASSGGFGKING